MSAALPPPSSSTSSTARASSTTGEASWLWQLLTTPVFDAARGKVRASVSAQRLAGASDLPAPLAGLVVEVVRRSKLWRAEQADIARELIAHFSDGLAAGRSPQQLATDFGDPAQAAKLLRRAAKRNRPWAWRAARFSIRGFVFTLLSIIAIYGVMAIRFYLGRPGPIIDYRPEINANALALGDNDKAWPLYREALLRMPAKRIDEKLLAPEGFARMPLPGEEGWDQVEAWLAQAAPAIEFARQVADKRGLGLVVGYPLSKEDAEVWPTIENNNGKRDITDPESDGMIGILLPHLGSMRGLTMALGWDVYRAAAAGDGATAIADLRALLAMSRHARETPLLINALVGNTMFEIARDRINWILANRPELFTDEQWIIVAHALAAMDDRALAMTMAGERTGFKDILQRLYTDDGAGDGRLTPLGLRWLNMLVSYDMSRDGKMLDDAMRYAGPALNAVVLGRRDMAREHDRLMDMMEAENARPLWLREESQADQILEGWMSSPIERLRHLPLCMMMPALGQAFINAEQSSMRRDATITAIALELFHRRHNRWPVTLAELVPATMPALPIDRFDGQTLRYRISDGRPVLYSVGTDREDDGGVRPKLNNPHLSDAQWSAQRWMPLSVVKRMNEHPSTVGPDGQVGPMYDGDWVLWPPLPEGPLKSPEQPAVQ